jgi:hypothetical protein
MLTPRVIVVWLMPRCERHSFNTAARLVFVWRERPRLKAENTRQRDTNTLDKRAKAVSRNRYLFLDTNCGQLLRTGANFFVLARQQSRLFTGASKQKAVEIAVDTRF